jgi:hypothetical protein
MSLFCNPEELADYQRQDCYYRKGGISKVMVLKSGHGIIDFTNATQVLAAITAGKAKILGGLKAELPEPSPVEGENPVACGNDTILDGFDYVVSIQDFNTNPTNDVFYQKLNTSQYAGIVLYFCEEDEIMVVADKVNFVSRLIVPKSNKEKQYYMVDAKWSASVNDPFPSRLNAPVGVF